MAVGRYLATDTGDSIRKFGSSIGDIAGGIADYKDMLARQKDRERARALQEMREGRYRDEEDRLRANQTFTMGKALASMGPERRNVLAGTLPDQQRFDLGYRREIPGMDLEIEPPTVDRALPPPMGAAPQATPTTITRPTRAAVDPFSALPESTGRMITYRGAEMPEDEYLKLRERESAAAYSGAPSASSRGFRPTTTDVLRVTDEILTEYDPVQQARVSLVPAAERAALIARARENELSLTEVVAEAQRLLEEHNPGGVPADTSDMLGPVEEEDDGPGIIGRIGSFLGDRLSEVERVRRGEPAEPETEEQPTVRYPWPRPEEFRERQPEGMYPPADDLTGGEIGPLGGPETDAPIDPSSRGVPAETQAKVDQLIERGVDDATIAAALARELGIDEAEALGIVEGRKDAPRLAPR